VFRDCADKNAGRFSLYDSYPGWGLSVNPTTGKSEGAALIKFRLRACKVADTRSLEPVFSNAISSFMLFVMG
jgi:hypothetical protein